ncbi:hypothetical protein NUZ5A_50169 [Candidatus Nitrosotenuis uzonensis]|uniref:Uncharacterized protein n=1 Tax=Candidatus Nitrosotenuis uzonensis TaxID=1407055 RepID=A0A812F1K2_9ARCH|nr:hypothetical protein NUZ5A_50169 [Candidatus Nitrosotenuis uzonensis]
MPVNPNFGLIRTNPPIKKAIPIKRTITQVFTSNRNIRSILK